MKVYEHRGVYNANKPVLIYERKYESGRGKMIKGVVKNGHDILKVGDVILSNYIGTTGTESLPYRAWEVMSIKERNTPKGHFIIDITDGGFIANVVPVTPETIEKLTEMGIENI